ncbi:hypothetical protein V3468_06100 [Flavobacterium oreochromis]
MSKGPKKLNQISGEYYSKLSTPSVMVIPANEKVKFDITEWQPDTTPKEKQNKRKWQWLDKEKNIIQQFPSAPNTQFSISLPKKLCGSYLYYAQVSIEDIQKSSIAKIGFRGYCPPKITKAEWRKLPNGQNIANGTPIKYGDTIYLYLETEGLNGDKLTIEVYNQDTLLKDKVIRTIVDVEVNDGKVCLKIPNTTLWMGAVFNIQETEEFYVKVKNLKGQYIVNSQEEQNHAEYLKIKKEVVSINIEKPTNTTAYKIGEVKTNKEVYGTCSFDELNIVSNTSSFGDTTKINENIFNKGKLSKKLLTKDGGRIFEIVASQENKLSINILNFKEKCRNTPKHSKGLKAYSEDYKEQIKEYNSDKVKLDISSKLSSFNLTPLKYIWPISNTPLSYQIFVNTCSYYNAEQSMFFVNVYPDIKWVLKFEYGCKYPIKYSDSWVKMRQSRIDDAIDKSQGAQIDGYNNELETTFKIALGAEFNDKRQKFDLTPEFEVKIKNLMKLFLSIKREVNNLLGDNENGGLVNRLPSTVKDKIKSTALKLGRAPITFEVMSPSLSFQLSWFCQNNYAKHFEVVQMIEGEFNFGPLIGAKGTLDLIAVSTYIPYIGQIVDKVDKALDLIGLKTTFAISGVGEIGVRAKLNSKYSKIYGFEFDKEKGGGVELNGKFGLEIELSAKGKWEVRTYVIVGAKHDIVAEASLIGTSYIKPAAGFTANNKDGLLIYFKADFDGAKVVGELKGGIDKATRSYTKEIIIFDEKPDLFKFKHSFK